METRTCPSNPVETCKRVTAPPAKYVEATFLAKDGNWRGARIYRSGSWNFELLDRPKELGSRQKKKELLIILYLNNYQAALLTSLTELQEALDRLKGAKAQFSGDCVAMDTIHHFVNQTRYYLFTAIDRYSRFAVAITCRRASSKNATSICKIGAYGIPWPHLPSIDQ